MLPHYWIKSWKEISNSKQCLLFEQVYFRWSRFASKKLNAISSSRHLINFVYVPEKKQIVEIVSGLFVRRDTY